MGMVVIYAAGKFSDILSLPYDFNYDTNYDNLL